jgi:hypothetical protein
MVHTEEIVLQVHYGTMTYNQAEKSMRLFAKEVLPAARELPTFEPLMPAAAPDFGPMGQGFTSLKATNTGRRALSLNI